MTAFFNPAMYAQLAPEVRLYALGLMPPQKRKLQSLEQLGEALGFARANVTRLEENPVLDTMASTRAKVEKAPYSVQKVGREALKLWIEPLAGYLAKEEPPRGLEQVLRDLSHEQLALLGLRSIMDQIHFGWDKRKDRLKKGGKRQVKNPDMLFRLELGQAVRDELEFAGLLVAKAWVKASKKKASRHAKLNEFRRVDWTRRQCARVGDWLWNCLAQLSCFDEDEHGYPRFHAEHKAALDKFAEEVLFTHPLYKPRLTEPPAWTAWRMECPGDIGATFVKASDPETIEAIKAAFDKAAQARLTPRERTGANNFWTEAEAFEMAGPSDAEDMEDVSIELHARAVSAIQSVPLKINAAMLPLVRQFAGDEYRRDVVVAEALVEKERFWNRVRCDRRGRLIQMCDFNYTRGDPVRSLFMFAEGKPLGHMGFGVAGRLTGRPIDWLEIAIANAYGIKGTWAERHECVAKPKNHALIKAVSVDPGLIWRHKIGAKEPFQFAAACIEYVAADTHGPTYVTHLPVWLDASSNGLQHLAIMRRDVKLAAMVNLKTRAGEPDHGIQDIYEIVGAHARQSLLADDDPSSRFWLAHELRDLLKQPIMTLPYGVTKPGMLDQIKKACEGLGIVAPREAMRRLRDHIWRAIEEKLPGAMETRAYIQGIARHCLDRGTYMQWVTPSGFPVDNRYRKSRAPRVRLPFLGQSVKIADGYTDEPRETKIINSAVANVTHSLDAAHLVLSVNAAVEMGITNLMTIHDSYATLAPDVHHFAQRRRWALAKMYWAYKPPLDALRAANLPRGTNALALPDFDSDFDVTALGESEYFDR
jgi:DNA-dependent RNA polymerase